MAEILEAVEIGSLPAADVIRSGDKIPMERDGAAVQVPGSVFRTMIDGSVEAAASSKAAAVVLEASGTLVEMEISAPAAIQGVTVLGDSTVSGTPNETTPATVTSVGESGTLTLRLSGKNLARDGSVTLKAAGNVIPYKYKIPVMLQAGTIAVSYHASKATAGSNSFLIRGADGKKLTESVYSTAAGDYDKTVTLTADQPIAYAELYSNCTGTFSNIMLSRTAEAYVPYQAAQTAAVTDGLPLRRFDTFRDELTISGSDIVRTERITHVSLAELTWVLQTPEDTPGRRRRFRAEFVPKGLPAYRSGGLSNPALGFCNLYPSISPNQAYSGTQQGFSLIDGGAVAICDDTLETVDDLTQKLLWANAFVDYVRASDGQTTYAAAPSLRSYDGVTYLTAEGAYTTAAYIADTRTYIDQAPKRTTAAMFGAKGDGATDDTAAFSAAITYANEHMCAIFLEPGTYVITSDLPAMLPGISIMGTIDETSSNRKTVIVDQRTTGTYLFNQSTVKDSGEIGGVFKNFALLNKGAPGNRGICLRRKGWTGLVENVSISGYATALLTYADDYTYRNLEIVSCGNVPDPNGTDPYALKIMGNANFQRFVDCHVEHCRHSILIGGAAFGLIFRGLHLEMSAENADDIIDSKPCVRIEANALTAANTFTNCIFSFLDWQHYQWALSDDDIPPAIRISGNAPVFMRDCTVVSGSYNNDLMGHLWFLDGNNAYLQGNYIRGLGTTPRGIRLADGYFRDNILRIEAAQAEAVNNINTNSARGNVYLYKGGDRVYE